MSPIFTGSKIGFTGSLFNAPVNFSNIITHTTTPTPIYSLTTDGIIMAYSYANPTSFVYRSFSPYTNWTGVNSSAGQYRYYVKYLGGVFLNFGGSNSGAIGRSTDAATWSECNIGGNGGSTSSFIVYNPSRNEWVAGCGSWIAGTGVRVSTDSVNFNSTFSAANAGDTFIATSGNNDASAYVFAVTTGSSTVIQSVARSQNAITWTESNWISLFGTSPPRFLEYFNGRYWLCNNNNVLGTSTDGLSWSTYSHPQLNFQMRVAGTFNINGIIYSYISGDTAFAISSDGINWTKYTHALAYLLNFIVIGSNVFCYSSGGSTIYRFG